MILRDTIIPCIVTGLIILYISKTSCANENKAGDVKNSETELLDKEYGVRYASACEGKLIDDV